MRYYLICKNTVTALPTAPDSISDNAIVLRRAAEIDPKRFPLNRIVELHNDLPGATPVRRFPSRPAGVKALWKCLAELPIGQASGSISKQAKVTALLRRPQGADLSELVTATGWQPHSVRGMLSGVLRKRLGLTVEATQDGDRRVYRVAA